jgi:nucleoside-diphosphate-sugar epimerase
MKIVVIGGAGYLGGVLTPLLISAGHKVTVLDNMQYGENSLALWCSHENFDFHRVDARDISAVRPHLAGAEVVIPLAGLVGAPLCNMNPVDAELLNTKAHLELFKSLAPDQLVINPSTESVYGRQPGGVPLTEESPVAPLVSYGVQKLEAERALAERPNSISFRMATLFGMSPRMRLDLLINEFAWRALKDRMLVVFEGKAMRTCLHVHDAAQAFLHCLSLPRPAKHGIYNLGSVTTSKLGLCEAIKKQVPSFYYVEAQYATDPDARDYVVADEKFRATGYAPTMTLDRGIAELLKGYRMLDNSRYSNV